MLFGIGNVSGVITSRVIFAVAPVIGTNLGVRQVPGEDGQAMLAFGATLIAPVRRPDPAGAADHHGRDQPDSDDVAVGGRRGIVVAVGGLGRMVLRGVGRLDMGTAVVGGIGIVVLAIVLDRLTQALHGDRASRAVASTSAAPSAQSTPPWQGWAGSPADTEPAQPVPASPGDSSEQKETGVMSSPAIESAASRCGRSSASIYRRDVGAGPKPRTSTGRAVPAHRLRVIGVADVSFQVGRGEIFCVMGLSGSNRRPWSATSTG